MRLTEEQRSLTAANAGLAGWAVQRIRRRYPDLDHDEALSVASLGLCRAALTYDPARGRFSTYAIICIMSAIRNLVVARRRPLVRLALVPHDVLCEVIPAPTGAEPAWTSKEIRELVDAALDAMTPAQREIVRMHYLDGVSYAEIARMRGVNRSAPRLCGMDGIARARRRISAC